MPVTRTVPGAEPALPRDARRDRAWSRSTRCWRRCAPAGWPATRCSRPPTTPPQLRFSWFPDRGRGRGPGHGRRRWPGCSTRSPVRRPSRGLAAAGLRRPGGPAPPSAPAPPLPAGRPPRRTRCCGPHHVDHVFATWYAADRRADVLVAVDVSGSMAARAPGSQRRLIDLVKDGFARPRPAAARRLRARPVGVRASSWPRRGTTRCCCRRPRSPRSTGARPTRGGEPAVGPQRRHRAARHRAGRLPRRPGRLPAGVPNHVVVFTDGHNEYDPGSLTTPS